MSSVCGVRGSNHFRQRAQRALGSWVGRDLADAFGLIVPRGTISFGFSKYFKKIGRRVIYKYDPYLGCGLIRNPQVAKFAKRQFLYDILTVFGVAPCDGVRPFHRPKKQDDSRGNVSIS